MVPHLRVPGIHASFPCNHDRAVHPNGVTNAVIECGEDGEEKASIAMTLGRAPMLSMEAVMMHSTKSKLLKDAGSG